MTTIATYVAIMLAVIVVAELLLRVPTLAVATLGHDVGRKQSLDGLRGILALSVMIHHMMLAYFLEGRLDTNALRAHPFINQLGSASVALFFMISAYLFGGRILSNRGLDFRQFVVGRITRIVPLYVFAVALVVILALAENRFVLIVPLETLAKQVIRQLLFDFVPRYDVNGSMRSVNLLGVVWSLKYEWCLYAVLPLANLLYRRSGQFLAVYAVLLAIAVAWSPFFYFFVTGVAVAQLVRFDGRRMRRIWQIGAAGSLAVLFTCFWESRDWPQALLLTPVLIAVIQGGSIYALLGSRPLRLLGEASFSIYLLHGPVLFLCLGAFHVEWAGLSLGPFIAVALAAAGCVVASSIATLLLIERPFHALGKPPSASAPPPAAPTPPSLNNDGRDFPRRVIEAFVGQPAGDRDQKFGPHSD